MRLNEFFLGVDECMVADSNYAQSTEGSELSRARCKGGQSRGGIGRVSKN